MIFSTSTVSFIVATVIYLGIRIFYKRKSTSGKKAINKSSNADLALVTLVVLGQIFLPLTAIFTSLLDFGVFKTPDGVQWFGVITMAFGVWLFWRSHSDLGNNWSVTLELEKDHELITTGVYHHVRHPMYAAFFVMSFGQLALIPNWIAGPSGLLAVALLYVIRKPNEEAMLMQHFGGEYTSYIAKTGGVIPRML